MVARQGSAVGFTIKSGWAAVVLLTGPPTAPRVADSRRVEISDPAVPDSTQPYHAGFGTARAAGDELERLVASVKAYGRRSVTALLREYSKRSELRAAGVVVGSLIDPKTIANDAAIRTTLTEIGREVDGGWRAEQKAAALSAWMVL